MKHTDLHAALVHRVQRAGGEGTAEACVTELGELVKRLGDLRLREGLLAALRLDPRFQQNKLTNRRQSFQQHLKGHPDPATRAAYVTNLRQFERRENEAIHGVANFLAAQEESEQDAPQVKQEAPTFPDVANEPIEAPSFPKVHSNFLTYRFTAIGVMQRQDVVKQLYAKRGETARTSSWETAYFADRRRGVVSVESDFGWRLLEAAELEDGTLNVTFELPRALTPNDGFYSVGYHATMNSDARCSPIVYWEPLTGSRQVDFRLIFDRKMKPMRAWWFIARSRGDALREPEPSAGRHLEVFDCGTHFYTHKHFESSSELAAHHVHGVAWIWPSD